jgi:predicted nucleic acid-binding protein
LIVVADSSPLRYLIQIGEVELLCQLYGEVQIPSAVIEELTDKSTPSAVREWMDSSPPWSSPPWIVVRMRANAPMPDRAGLGRGESEAIELAIQPGAELVLIDDRRGVEAAFRAGLRARGTPGVLLDAHRLQIADARRLLDTLLAATSFYHTPSLRGNFLETLRLMERKR